jgi:hypothetical protein
MFRAARALVDAAGAHTDAGRETSERIGALTDELATPRTTYSPQTNSTS